MRRNRSLRLVLPIGALLAVSAFGSADTEVTMHVRVDHAPATASSRIPLAGAYGLSFGRHEARVALPDGTYILFNFYKKVVSTVDPVARSFYQESLADFMTSGDKPAPSVASRYSVALKTDFSPTVGQDPRTFLEQKCPPSNLSMDAELRRKSQSNGLHGFGGGHHHGGFPGGGFPGSGSGGGGSYPGDPSASSGRGGPSSLGCSIGSEMWTATSAPNVDPTEFSSAACASVLRNLPGLKALTDKLASSKLAFMGADFSISFLDSQGGTTGTPPLVSVEVGSTRETQVDPGQFSIPADYAKVTVPAHLLGTS